MQDLGNGVGSVVSNVVDLFLGRKAIAQALDVKAGAATTINLFRRDGSDRGQPVTVSSLLRHMTILKMTNDHNVTNPLLDSR